jgi:hypothetical protein
MAAPKKKATAATPRQGATKRMWPVGKSNKEVSRSVAGAFDIANSRANIGDSLESRLTGLMLGGGSDFFDGQFGYTGEFLDQSIYSGEESTGRGNRSLFGKKGRGETKVAWTKIKIVRDVYDNDGQVASIVDLMADFATEGVNFAHIDKGAQNFYRVWSEKVKIRQRVRRTVIDLLIAGNAFLYKVYARLSDTEKRSMKRQVTAQTVGKKLVISDADGNETVINPKIEYDSIVRLLLDPEKKKSDAAFKDQMRKFVEARLNSKSEQIVEGDIAEDEKNVVPWKYISLNPLQMRPNKSGGWSYLLGKADMMQLAAKVGVTIDENAKSLKVTLPDGLSGNIKPIKDIEGVGFFAEMELTDERLVHISWNKYDWCKWGSPGGLVWKAMPTITFKNTLRAMEQKTAQAAINMVYLWKLGDHKEGLIPTLEDYERLADMLKAPASTLNVLWNSAVSAEVIQPKLGDIFDPQRWEGLRAELTSQFGITQAIITGEGGNFSSSFISVQGLLERLQSLRDLLIEEWLRPEALQIKEAMGFQKLPNIVFNQMSLRDKTAENSFLKELYDRGIISDETMMEAIDRDVDVERSRLRDQEDFMAENDMARKGPFDVNKDQLDWEKEKKEKDDDFREEQFEHSKEVQEKQFEETKRQNDKKPDGAPQPKGPGGKPKGPTGPQKKKRESKPKNLAQLDVETLVKDMDNKAKAAMCDSEAVRDYRGLSKAGKQKVDDIVLNHIAAASRNETAFHIEFDEARSTLVAATNKQPTKAEFHQMLVKTFMEMQGE